MKPLLQAENINLRIGDHQILDNVGFELEEGQITTIVGPNGAGKTCLIRILLGLQKPTSGKITLAPGSRVGYMPQKLAIDNTLPLSVKGFLRLADPSIRHCREALDRVGVPQLMDSPIAHLSGGETQRILLARALLRKPHLLVLDEPVQGVDVNGQEGLYKLIGNIRQQLGCAILMVSHDLHLVMAATDEVLCLNHHVCCSGTPEYVSSDPQFAELFGHRTALYTHHHDHDHDLHGCVDGEHEEHCHHG